MLVWLKLGETTVGVRDGIVRAADVESFASIGQMQAACARLCAERLELAEADAKQRLAEADAEVQRRIAEAEAEAKRLVEAGHEAARVAYEQARTEGYEAGQRKAADIWHRHHLQSTLSRAQVMDKMQNRLSQIVTSAVERIVQAEPREALYERAANNIASLCRGATALTLRVAEQDVQPARAALLSLERLRERGIALELEIDTSLKAGACIFESDLGIVDASLDVQIGALRSAMERALGKAALTDDLPADEDEAAEDDADPVDATDDGAFDDGAEDDDAFADDEATDDDAFDDEPAFDDEAGEDDDYEDADDADEAEEEADEEQRA